MGFGLLLIGFLLYLNVIFPFITVPFAGVLFAFGLRKLAVWNSGFSRARVTNYPLILLGIGTSVAYFRNTMNATADSPEDPLTNWLCFALWLLLFLFNFFLISGIVELATEVRLPRMRDKAIRCRNFVCVYWLLRAYMELDLGDKLNQINGYALLPMILIGFIVMIMEISLVFCCYTDIGMPDENKVPEKKGFLSKMKQKNEEAKK